MTYPCTSSDDPGQPVIFTERFPTASGKGRFVAASLLSADELPDKDYPLALITGRLLEHWHTGAMSRRAEVLDRLEPEAVAYLHPTTLGVHGLGSGDRASLRSRRGSVELTVIANERLQSGQAFLPFCYREAAANLLTNEALDPFGKIPEYKYCAVRITAL